jgi:hypothetical protein
VSHTPAPWIWTDHDELHSADAWSKYAAWEASDFAGQPVDFPKAIIETDGGVYGPYGDDRLLIAAAPDLLAALKLIVDHFGDPLKVARPAIAKAEGNP